jgi:hypothetical protein
MSGLFVILLLVVISIQISIVFSRTLLGFLFVALEAAAMRQQAPAVNSTPFAIGARVVTENTTVRLAA